jgi:hypothetical protein
MTLVHKTYALSACVKVRSKSPVSIACTVSSRTSWRPPSRWTIKNVVNIVARENLALGNEEFCRAVAQRLLDAYDSKSPVSIACTVSSRTSWRPPSRWTRITRTRPLP